MLTVIAYAIKIVISTFIIYLSIRIVEGYNYRNNLQNALLTATLLSIIGGTPFIFFFALVIWVFILINYYSIGFLKSFLIAFVYGVISVLLQIFLVAGLISGGFVIAKMTDTSTYAEQWDKVKQNLWSFLGRLPKPLRKKLGIKHKYREPLPVMPEIKKVRIVFKNGRSIEASILMEGRKGYLLDIANGKSEVVLRKDSIAHIEDIK